MYTGSSRVVCVRAGCMQGKYIVGLPALIFRYMMVSLQRVANARKLYVYTGRWNIVFVSDVIFTVVILIFLIEGTGILGLLC